MKKEEVYKTTLWVGAGALLVGALLSPITLALSVGVPPWLSEVRTILLLVGLVASIVGIERRLEQIETLGEEIRDIKQSARDIAISVPLDSTSRQIAEILRTANIHPNNQFVHTKVTANVISDHFYTYIPVLAEAFKALNKPEQAANLKEISLINKLTATLINSVPHNTVWCGITLVTDARSWNEKSAEPDFATWARRCRERSHSNEVRIFRCYYFKNNAEYEQLYEVLKREAAAGITIRILTPEVVGSQIPPDITLLWQFTEGDLQRIDLEEPLKFLKTNGMALCSLEFNAKHSRVQDYLSIYGPQSDQFGNNAEDFARYWKAATPLEM